MVALIGLLSASLYCNGIVTYSDICFVIRKLLYIWDGEQGDTHVMTARNYSTA